MQMQGRERVRVRNMHRELPAGARQGWTMAELVPEQPAQRRQMIGRILYLVITGGLQVRQDGFPPLQGKAGAAAV